MFSANAYAMAKPIKLKLLKTRKNSNCKRNKLWTVFSQAKSKRNVLKYNKKKAAKKIYRRDAEHIWLWLLHLKSHRLRIGSKQDNLSES